MFSMNVAKNNQYACSSIIELDEQFKKSCDMCCMSPYNNIDCDHCPLQQAHDYMIEQLKKSIKSKDEK